MIAFEGDERFADVEYVGVTNDPARGCAVAVGHL